MIQSAFPSFYDQKREFSSSWRLKKILSDFFDAKSVSEMKIFSYAFSFGSEFDVDPTRYPRGKWGFSNKNPTSGPPTVGFPRVVLSLTIMSFLLFLHQLENDVRKCKTS